MIWSTKMLNIFVRKKKKFYINVCKMNSYSNSLFSKKITI